MGSYTKLYMIGNLKRRRIRKKTLNSDKRQKLIELVNYQNYSIKDVAQNLNIKVSTIKSVLRAEKKMRKNKIEEFRKFVDKKKSEARNEFLLSNEMLNNMSEIHKTDSTDDMMLLEKKLLNINDFEEGYENLRQILNYYQTVAQECYDQINSNQNLLTNLMKLSMSLKFQKEN